VICCMLKCCAAVWFVLFCLQAAELDAEYEELTRRLEALLAELGVASVDEL
jgi:hypothetical protein